MALTFDGSINGNDAELILDTLRERGIKTTMFLTGAFIKRFPGLTRQMAMDGHEVGNHLLSHPHRTEYSQNYTHNTLPHVTREFLTRQLRGVEKLFREVTGSEMAPLWRAPYGEVNARLRGWAFEAGYVHVGWTSDFRRRESLDTLDWVSDRGSKLYRSSAEIRDKVLNFGRKTYGVRGGIILMHLGTQRRADKAAERLDEILDGLSSRGYRLVRVSSLIARMGDGARALDIAAARKRGATTGEFARLKNGTKPGPSL